MRDMRCRAWHKKRNRYIPVSGLIFDSLEPEETGNPGGIMAIRSSGETIDCDDVETEWFTGLCDKNGREIYEGDLIDHNGEVFQVCFEPGEVIMRNIWGQTRGLCIAANDILNECIIIGNIHENPEMLK